jgi:3-methyladenine DNA glycosylase Mpg
VSCGPGNVGQALGLHLEQNGLPLGEDSGIFVLDDGVDPTVERTTRIGISQGDQLLLRYCMTDSVYVSRQPRGT